MQGRFRGIGLHILISLEKYSVFRAFHLFVFAAKKRIKYSKIRTAESSCIQHYVVETDLFLSYLGIPHLDKVRAIV